MLNKSVQLRESILLLVMIAVISYGIVTYLYTPRKERLAEIRTKVAEITEKKSGLEKLNEALQQKYNQQNEELEKQSSADESADPKIQMIKQYRNPQYKDISSLLNTLAQNGLRVSLTLDSIRYDRSTTKTGYEETKFFITANGRFTNAIEFIKLIETLPALVTLDQLSVKLNQKDSNAVTLDIIGTYFQLGGENGA